MTQISRHHMRVCKSYVSRVLFEMIIVLTGKWLLFLGIYTISYNSTLVEKKQKNLGLEILKSVPLWRFEVISHQDALRGHFKYVINAFALKIDKKNHQEVWSTGGLGLLTVGRRQQRLGSTDGTDGCYEGLFFAISGKISLIWKSNKLIHFSLVSSKNAKEGLLFLSAIRTKNCIVNRLLVPKTLWRSLAESNRPISYIDTRSRCILSYSRPYAT